MLTLVTSIEEVIENIRTYQTHISRSSRATPSGVRQWYYLPKENIAGPSRFIGYKKMTAERYDRHDRSHQESVDGRITEPALKRLGRFRELQPGERDYGKARAAAQRLAPPGKHLRSNAKFHVLN